MNENRIQQVLEIEKQAQEIHDKASLAAKEIPVKAEQEALALIARAKAEANEEARKIIESAQSNDASGQITADIASKNSEFETLAKKNFDKAVSFVLERVIGRA